MTDAGQPEPAHTALDPAQLHADALVVGPERRQDLMSAFGQVLTERGPRSAMDAFGEVEAAGVDLSRLLRNADGSPTAESAFFSALHDLAGEGAVEVDVAAVTPRAGAKHPDVAPPLEGYQHSLNAGGHEQPFAVLIHAHQHVADVMTLAGFGVELGSWGRQPSVRAMADPVAVTGHRDRAAGARGEAARALAGPTGTHPEEDATRPRTRRDATPPARGSRRSRANETGQGRG